ncbi:hypothetical protein KUTeg_015150 [Tegillarca granosa]|uniref:Uncharacterized protein n=1 Tax=Tegillarca granosa TaxID=220873 RepID=A0ABQ9ERQ6_TEGGR|nr:hypothetical protein KUTeg_015150 [Tegillarca granosa]
MNTNLWHPILGIFIVIKTVICFKCDKDATECETSLIIEQRISMVHQHKGVYPSKGALYYVDVTNTSAATPVDPQEVISLDGWEKTWLVTVANRSLTRSTDYSVCRPNIDSTRDKQIAF